jgi:enoyl-CoA hydratase/carnithine racemase
LTAAADISACLSGTTFSFPEAALGLVPGVLTPVVTRRIGVSKFLELALTGRKLAASEAQLAGLVHFAGSRRLLDRYVDRAIQGILSAPSQTIRRIKASVLAGSAIPRRRLVELASLTAAARTGEEARI